MLARCSLNLIQSHTQIHIIPVLVTHSSLSTVKCREILVFRVSILCNCVFLCWKILVATSAHMVFAGFICGDCLALVSGQSVSQISFVELVFDCKAAPFLGCCVHLGVLGTQVAVLHRAHTSGFCSTSQQLFSAQRGIAVALGRCVLRHQAWHLLVVLIQVFGMMTRELVALTC